MASRALMARLTSAEVSWLRSTSAGQAWSLNAVSISICLPSVGASSLTTSSTRALTSVSSGRNGCFLAKASRFAVSCDARSAASLIILAIDASAGSCLTPSARISIVPVITVSMLLKSWAMPPVNCPTDSIFCAWNNCSSAARFAVMSLTNALMM